MNIKASGRSALIIAAGFWVCVSGPLQAAEDADGGVTASRTETAAGPPVALNKFAKKSRHWKHVSSQRKSVKVASRDLHRDREDFREEDFGEKENRSRPMPP